VVGGFVYTSGNQTFRDTVAAYDPASNSWGTVARMPVARAYVAVTQGTDGRIYTIGGYCGRYCDRHRHLIEIYDPQTGRWLCGSDDAKCADHSLTPIPMSTFAPGSLAVALSDGRILVVGVQFVEAYDPKTNSWTCSTNDTSPGCVKKTIAPPIGLNCGGGVVLGSHDHVYLISECGPSAGGIVEAFDATANTWTSLGPVPTLRQYFAATSISDGRIFVIGGLGADGHATNVVEALRPDGHWDCSVGDSSGLCSTTELAPLPTPRYQFAGAATADGTIVTAGGGDGTNVVEAYNPFSITGSVTRLATDAPKAGLTYGEPETLVATVAGGAVPATGTVAFTDNGARLGQKLLLNGQAMLRVASLPAGIHHLSAIYDGSASAGPSTGRFTQIVKKARLTVTCSSESKRYDSPNPSLPWTVQGLKNGDQFGVVSGTPTCTTSAVDRSPVGRYAINADVSALQAANYTFRGVNGTLIVFRARLTITASSRSVTYGHRLPPLTWQANFLPGDSITSLLIQPHCVATAKLDQRGNVSSPAATYPLTCSDAAARN
jgi:hypothetical protein